MKVCLLSLEEVGKLEKFGDTPRCEEHRHITNDDAIEGLRNDTYVTVIADGVCAVREQFSNNRHWAGCASGGFMGFQVLQLVRF